MGHTHIHARVHTYTRMHAWPCAHTHACMRAQTHTLHTMYYHVLRYKIAEGMLSIGIKYLKYIP